MNNTYQLHDETAKRLHGAAIFVAILLDRAPGSDGDDLRAAAGTLAAQNPELGE